MLIKIARLGSLGLDPYHVQWTRVVRDRPNPTELAREKPGSLPLARFFTGAQRSASGSDLRNVITISLFSSTLLTLGATRNCYLNSHLYLFFSNVWRMFWYGRRRHHPPFGRWTGVPCSQKHAFHHLTYIPGRVHVSTAPFPRAFIDPRGRNVRRRDVFDVFIQYFYRYRSRSSRTSGCWKLWCVRRQRLGLEGGGRGVWCARGTAGSPEKLTLGKISSAFMEGCVNRLLLRR